MNVSLNARELPDLRLRMAEFMNGHGLSWMHHTFSCQPAWFAEEADDEIRASFTDSVCEVLNGGELFYLDEHMTSIATSSALPINKYGFMPWDLPAKQALMYFAEPHADPLDGRAVVLGWNVHEPTAEYPHGHANLFVFMDKHALRRQMEQTSGTVGILGEDYDRLQADYVLFTVLDIIFAEAGDGVSFWAADDGLQTYIQLLFSTCHLMRQQLAETSSEPVPRATRRRYERDHRTPPQVRVCRLRRSERPETTGESAREWHHRWIVRGHWRQQWYPSIQAHRPVWIAPFVKGPQDAPLLGGEKVYAVTD